MNRKNIVIGVILLIAAAGSFVYVLIKQPDQTPIISQVNKTYDSVVEANNQFALDLYQKYRSKEGNLMFSPYSISSALAMTYEGAKGQTAEEMQRVLHLPGDSVVRRSEYSGIYDWLNKANKPYKLSTANALWAQKDYPFESDFFGIVEKYYGGKVTNLDFRSDTENSRKTINKWVEDKTYERIQDLIPEGFLTPTTRLVLTNALYFNASWLSQFEAGETDDQDFKTASGTSVKARMMHMTAYYNYSETGALQILEKPYLGDDISMLIILPKNNNIGSLENAISTANLAGWKKNMKLEYVKLSLPKYKYENKYFMAKDLKEMGRFQQNERSRRAIHRRCYPPDIHRSQRNGNRSSGGDSGGHETYRGFPGHPYPADTKDIQRRPPVHIRNPGKGERKHFVYGKGNGSEQIETKDRLFHHADNLMGSFND
jgi:serine protease inhibitor